MITDHDWTFGTLTCLSTCREGFQNRQSLERACRAIAVTSMSYHPPPNQGHVDFDDGMIHHGIQSGRAPLPLLDTLPDLRIDETIRNWAQDNVDKISRAYALKGGWEGWAQVEIALLLEDHLAHLGRGLNIESMTASREVAVYQNPRQFADLVIGVHHGRAQDHIIVELKCESQFNATNFITGIMNDLAKIEDGIKPEYQPAMRFVYGIGKTPEGVSQGVQAGLFRPETLVSRITGQHISFWGHEAERVDNGMYDDFIHEMGAAGHNQPAHGGFHGGGHR